MVYSRFADTDDQCREKAKKGTAKLLARLQEHHDYSIVKPTYFVPPTKEEIHLCDNCRDPLVRIDGLTRVQDIKRAATRYFDLKPLDLDSHRRTAKISMARQIAMYLSRTLTLKSYPEIARRMGGRDHTTAIHACTKIERLVREDWKVAFDVAYVEAML